MSEDKNPLEELLDQEDTVEDLPEDDEGPEYRIGAPEHTGGLTDVDDRGPERENVPTPPAAGYDNKTVKITNTVSPGEKRRDVTARIAGRSGTINPPSTVKPVYAPKGNNTK